MNYLRLKMCCFVFATDVTVASNVTEASNVAEASNGAEASNVTEASNTTMASEQKGNTGGRVISCGFGLLLLLVGLTSCLMTLD